MLDLLAGIENAPKDRYRFSLADNLIVFTYKSILKIGG